MTEQQGKFLIKHIVDNGYKNISKDEKELFKQAIDQSKNYDELFAIITDLIVLSNSRNDFYL